MDELNFTFKMPDDETLAKYISIKGEKGEIGDPTKLSELENDTGFVTASTDALANYYTKSQTDTALNSKVDNSTLEAIAIPDSFFTGEETITESGTFIELENTADAVLKEVKFYGDTQQDGTPTPENPVAIQVVTGDQTIIISDGDQQSQSYTLSLGDIELCKIGNRQDYIYKSGNAWYIHKAIASITLDGSETWGMTGGTSNPFLSVNLIGAIGNYCDGLCTHFVNRKAYPNSDGYFAIRGSGKDLYCYHADSESLSDWEAWLLANKPKVYYPLATQVEVLITDSTVVAQLEAIKNASTYHSETAITISGSLSASLTVEAFKDNLSGTMAGIDNTKADKQDIVRKLQWFNSVLEMKASTSLSANMTAMTKGYHYAGDGGGSVYSIRPRLSSDVGDSKHLILVGSDLTAVVVRNNTYIEEVTCNEYLDSTTNTKYWITHIPNKDQYGNVLRLKLGLADDALEQTGHLETARSFAKRHKATVVINGGVGDNASAEMTGRKYGMRMKDGVLISNQASSWWQLHWAIGVTATNSLVTFAPPQTEEEARALGCVDATSGFTPILIDGVSQKFLIKPTSSWFTKSVTQDTTPDSTKTYYTENNTSPYYTAHTNLQSFESGVTYYEIEDVLYQKQIVAQNSTTKDIYFLTCNGKGVANDLGMATDKIIEILTGLGCDFAYQMDGGGSTSLVYHGELMNNPTDDNGKTERPCADFLYVSYEDLSPYSDELNNINARLADIKRDSQLANNYDLENGAVIPSGSDLNNFNQVGVYYSENRAKTETLSNIPDISTFIGYEPLVMYGFKLIVEKLTAGVYLQTMLCESSPTGKTYKFTRQFSHDSEQYTWRQWELTECNDDVDVPITMQGEFTIANKSAICKNGRVCLNFELTGSFTSTNAQVMTIPSAYAPSLYVHAAGVTSNLKLAQIQVRPDGKIFVRTDGSETKVRANVTYDL